MSHQFSWLTSFRKADAMGDPLTDGNFLNLTEAELDQHIYRNMRESFVLGPLEPRAF